MTDLMTVARRFLATPAGENGGKGEKPPGDTPFPPFPPFPPVGVTARSGEPALSGAEPWVAPVALRLLSEADALVERLGVSGRHPAVAGAAAMVASAFATRDPETVRFAVAEFVMVVRRLARGRYMANGVGEHGPNHEESVLSLAERWRHPQSTRTA